MSHNGLVGSAEIAAATKRLADRVVLTPLLECERLSAAWNCRVLLKAENLQHTGSFKVRGAFNALLARRERGEHLNGVATFSAGNHGAATAYAGSQLGLPVVVCMPQQAVPAKVAAVRRHGGEVVSTDDLLATCHAIAGERGYAVLPPFDDLDIIAGQATVGAELIEQARSVAHPDGVELILVPVGGGGLISGVAAGVKSASPQTRIVGVEPSEANAMTLALQAGEPVTMPRKPRSIADGLTAPFAGAHTLRHVQQLVEQVVVVAEEAIAPGWWDLLDASKLLVEPAAAVGAVAINLGLVQPAAGSTLVLVLSGGNMGSAGLSMLAGLDASDRS